MDDSDKHNHQITQLTTTRSNAPLERIGYGSCGSVWADSSLFPDIDKYGCSNSATETAPGREEEAILPIVLKRADGLPDRSLKNEVVIHRQILSTVDKFNADIKTVQGGKVFHDGFIVNIPRHVAFFDPSAPVWKQILPRLPSDSTKCQALISERILPLSRDSRALLAHTFWDGPAHLRENIVNDKRNEHCLVRPYLGRRRRCRTLKPGTTQRTTEKDDDDENKVMVDERPGHLRLKTRGLISLRNYPLHIDQIEELVLPAEECAAAMADAPAFLLWGCEVDACDVEFVLARARPQLPRHHHGLGGGDDYSEALPIDRTGSTTSSTDIHNSHVQAEENVKEDTEQQQEKEKEKRNKDATKEDSLAHDMASIGTRKFSTSKLGPHAL
ncbi:hypothetical protein V8F33_006847 [Rhypophila sp. PSN 637]